MAKLYDFRFVVRRVDFDASPGMVHVPVGASKDVYHQSSAQMEFKAALALLKAISDAEPRSHQACLTMKYRDDRKPPGFNKAARTIHRRGE